MFQRLRTFSALGIFSLDLPLALAAQCRGDEQGEASFILASLKEWSCEG